MGTWDIGFFDNDMACDWENSLKDEQELIKIEEPLNIVNSDNQESLDIDIANRALAAAEALARLLLKDGEKTSYTIHLDEWAEKFSGEISKDLIIKSQLTLDKIILPSSELFQFWKLRADFDQWLENIQNLKNRLSSTMK